MYLFMQQILQFSDLLECIFFQNIAELFKILKQGIDCLMSKLFLYPYQWFYLGRKNDFMQSIEVSKMQFLVGVYLVLYL